MAYPYSDENEPKLDPINLENGKIAFPIKFNIVKPTDKQTGEFRDQTGDAAKNMRYAATLNLPVLSNPGPPRMGRAVIVGGAPSVKGQLRDIKKLAKDPDNAIFALNWTHTWLINQGIVPYATVFFEIDAEPDTVLKNIRKDVVYYICSHCDQKTFDALAGYKRILWHSPPNSPGEKEVHDELYPNHAMVGGGINSFTRTVSIALMLGYRNIEIFGCDGSFPEDSKSTHVEGYETPNNVKTDSLEVVAVDTTTGERRTFKTVGYLALQTEEFKEYCKLQHQMFACRVHGDGMLAFVHRKNWPHQYVKLPYRE